MTPSRRGLFGLIAAAGAIVSARAAHGAPAKLDIAKIAKDTDIACLYHCDFGDPQRFSQMLQNINNHLSVYDFDPMRIKIVIVAHGPGVKFFLKDLAGTPWEKETIDPDIYKRFVGLSKYGVEAYLCQITYSRLKIDEAKTQDGESLHFVPSGVATVGELQAKGFGYLKVG